MSDKWLGQMLRGEIVEPGFSAGLQLLMLHHDLIGDTERLRDLVFIRANQ